MNDHDPGRYGRLRVFISSTGDLQAERGAVAEALSVLDVDGIRFESWPSTPYPPISEAVRRLDDCDAVVLLLGRRYGTRSGSGLSVTHLEYRRAVELRKPVFAYLLEVSVREPEQELFVREVRQDHFQCSPIRSLHELQKQVTRSLLDEFTRCFREVHTALPAVLTTGRAPMSSDIADSASWTLPSDYQDALPMLQAQYDAQADAAIQRFANEVEARFRGMPDILNIVFMAEVNLAMDNRPVDVQRIRRAVEHWSDPQIRQRYRDYALDYSLGNALGVLGRLPEAIERYRAALRSNPRHAQTWKNLGTAYLETGVYEEGKKCIEEALRLDPQLFEAAYSLGVLSLQRENDPEAALGYFDRITASGVPSRRLGGVYAWRAIAYGRLGRFPEGIMSAEDAIANASEATWAWQNAARLYAVARRQDKAWLVPAAGFWGRFLARFPHSSDAWAEAGWVHWTLWHDTDSEEERGGALAAFTKAVENGHTERGLIWDRIGHLQQAVSNWEAAEQAFRRAVKEDEDQFGYCLGVSLIALGQYEQALLLVQAATQHHPDAESWFQVGLCQEKLGNVMAAVEAYETAIALDPDYPHPRFNLGGLYWNRRDTARAKEIWNEAIAKSPNHPLAQQARQLLGER